MGTDWANIDDQLGDSTTRDGEVRQRDSEKWRMPSDSDDLVNFAKMVTAPEDLHMLPQDMALLPQEINNDLNEWTTVAAPSDSSDWSTVADPT